MQAGQRVAPHSDRQNQSSPFVRNAWYVAAWADEVTTSPLARTICDEPIVLYRDQHGHAAALLDSCCHRGAPLSLGQVTEEGLQCAYHGLVFDTAGQCIRLPGQAVVPKALRVRSYLLVEKDGMLWIWPGEAEQADAEAILDYPWHNDPLQWPSKHDILHVQAGFMLLADNLMDLTHLAYVHSSTIGGNPAGHVSALMDIKETPTGVKFTRWMLDQPPPPTYSKAVRLADRVDRWQEFEYVAPGAVLQWSGATNAGTGAHDQNKREGGFSIRLFHGLTPATASTAHYFWSAANGYRQDEPDATGQLFDEIARAFQEDKTIVERQAARLLEIGEDHLMDIRYDSARLAMRRALDRLGRADAAQSSAR